MRTTFLPPTQPAPHATTMDEVHATEVEVKMTTEKATSGSELNISALNPDADGDGNVSALEMEIYKALKAADIDGSGSIGTGELYSVIGSLVEEKRKVKSLSKLVAGLIVVIILALASIFGVSMIAGETIKESKVAATTAETVSILLLSQWCDNGHYTVVGHNRRIAVADAK